ncbi:TraB/GumN family protein [Novosphingobium lentum]|uniref:TraB/GumN family protein n=1 Tax=Novosphingobium lentum TaxID=145287 RepID=UPI000833F022|nr:TraB/GumN family protein [Novosphingobium lentum]
MSVNGGSFRKIGVALAFALGLAGCHGHKKAEAPQARVALWEITDATGPRAWLMGTVHALPDKTVWLRPEIAKGLGAADRLVLEIGEPLDQHVAGIALARLAYTPGMPPPSERIDPAHKAELLDVYRRLGVSDDNFTNEENWAVALQLAAIAGEKDGQEPGNGVEPALRKLAGKKPVVGMETIDSQFGIFDALPPRQQQVLLEQVAVEAASKDDEDRDMLKLWLKGDEDGIARESQRGFLADPGLHAALLSGRNHDWARQIDAMLRSGARPFVAVGAAHVAGNDGLPALLAERGWTVRRIP